MEKCGIRCLCYAPWPISVPRVYLLLHPTPICTTGPLLPLLPDYSDIAAYLDIKQLLSQHIILYCLPLLDSVPTLLTPSLRLILIDSCTRKSFLTLFYESFCYLLSTILRTYSAISMAYRSICTSL